VNGARRQSSHVVPYLTVANVTRGVLRLDVVKEIGTMKSDIENYRLQKGDVLFIEGNGNPRLLGSAATWNDQLPLVLHQNHLIRARPNQKIVLPEWVMNYVNTDNGRTQLLGRAKTSSGLHSINSRVIGSLHIPIPAPAEQHAVSNILRLCNAKIDSLANEKALLDEVFKAMLEQLMTGQLSAVPLIEAEAAA
jgi:type I restriction enzyme S subunit